MAEKFLVVTEDIPFNGNTVFAYRKGDKIAESAVKANGWEAYVAPAAQSAASGKEKN